MLILKIENFNIILINVHAHTEDKDEEEKEIFYVTLEDVLSTSRGQAKLITKNLNVNIGREQCYRNIIGNYSLHITSNNNRIKLIDFSTGKGLIIKSITFPKKDIHKYIWIFPGGKYNNQIDYVLINSRLSN